MFIPDSRVDDFDEVTSNHIVIIFFVVLLFFLTLKKTFQVRAIKFNLVFSTFASIFLENTTAV